MQKTIWMVVLGMIVFTVSGCLNGGIRLEVQYDDLAGIQKGDRVLRENEAVGVVTKVVAGEAENEPGSAFVTINQEKSDGVTENTRFYVDPDPEKEGHQAIVLEQFREGGKVLTNGAVVKGSERALSYFHELADELSAGLGSLKSFFEGLKDDLDKATESDAVKKFEKELRGLAEKMDKSSEQWRQQFQEEVLPELQKQFEALWESLEKLGKSEEVQKLKQQLEGLSQT